MTVHKMKNLLGWMTAAVIVAAVFVAQVWKQNEYIKLNRNHSAIKAQLEKVTNDIAGIQLDNKKLKDYKRLEKMAKEKFGLVYAGVPEFIYPDGQKPVENRTVATAAVVDGRK